MVVGAPLWTWVVPTYSMGIDLINQSNQIVGRDRVELK